MTPSANQKYKQYKRAGGTFAFADWIELVNRNGSSEHLNVTGQEIADAVKDKIEEFKPSDHSKKESGIKILGLPASTVMIIVAGTIVIGTVWYYTNKQAQTA